MSETDISPEKQPKLDKVTKDALRKKVLGLELDENDHAALDALDDDAIDAFVQFVKSDQRLVDILATGTEEQRYSPDSKLGKLGLTSELETIELMNAGEEDNSLHGMAKQKSLAGVAVAKIDYDGSLGGGSPKNPLRIGGVVHK